MRQSADVLASFERRLDVGQIEYELTNDVQLKDLSDFYRRQGHPTTEQNEKLILA